MRELAFWSIVMAIVLTSTCVTASSARAADRAASELLGVERIWDKAPHNAFTDLIRYKDQWVCAFREAPEHKGGVKGSKIRVIASPDAKQWTPVGELVDPRGDIRDAKLAILPDGRLTMLTATQLFDQSKQTHQSIAFYTSDLKSWEGPVDVGEPSVWLWGIEFHKGAGYSIGYGTAKEKFARLYRTTDGVKYEPIVEKLPIAAKFPNESALVFDEQDTAYLLQRCDPDPGFVGTAKPPYTDWTIKQSNARVGGPAITRTPDGRLLGVVRLYDGDVRTSLVWIDPNTAQITESLKLPSAGDTSYAGLVWHEGVLYVSYYSTHEDKKSCIYLARVKVPGAAAGANGTAAAR